MEDVAFLLSETSNLNSDCPRQSHSLRLKKQCEISYGQENTLAPLESEETDVKALGKHRCLGKFAISLHVTGKQKQ